MRRHARYEINVIFIIILSLLFTNNLFAEQKAIKISPKTKEHRLALLIGNSNYIHGGSLKNSVTDVRAMKRALEGLGFTVMKYENCTQKAMKKVMDKFGKQLKGQDVGLFFYSGHGVQVNGHNYLIPTSAKLHNENDAEYDCVRADRVLAKMESAGTKTSIVILDACRDNPFERSWRKGTKGTGLAFMNAPSGSLIAYSTAPGKTALDGRGKNSPYTYALLQHITTPNITILEMFQGVRSTVMGRTGGKQTPWESTSLRGNFYFNDERGIAAMTHPKQEGVVPAEKSRSEDIDLLLQMAMLAEKSRSEDIDLLLQMARLKEKANDIEGAASAYKRIIEISPDHEEARDFQFRLLVQRLDLSLQMTQKERLNMFHVNDDATPPHALKKIAKLFINTEPGKSRVRILNIKPRFYQGMELKPGKYHIEVSSNGYKTKKMWSRLRTGEIKTLQINLEKVTNKHLASIQEEFRDSSPAEATKRLDVDALYNQTEALIATGKYLEAIKILDRAIELNPGVVKAYTARGIAYCYLKQYTKSMQDINKVIELHPNNAVAYGVRGIVFHKMGLEDRGCADLTKACDLDSRRCVFLGEAKKRGRCQFYR